MFQIFDKYGWLVLLIFSVGNALSFRSRQHELLKEHSQLMTGFRRRVWGYFVFWSAPWWVMGMGIMAGAVSGVAEFTACSRNMFVLGFFAFTILMCSAVGIWIWLFDGASYLTKYHVVEDSPLRLKIEYGVALLGMTFIVLSACLWL